MGERTGIGLVEATVLDAFDLVSGQGGGFVYEGEEYFACESALLVVEQRIGLAPDYAYEVLLDLARPWTLRVPLLSKCGNFGSRGNDPPAGFRYTKARLSPAGQVALAAERGEMAPVPIGLINGSTHRGGTRPPFRPEGIMGAIREVIRRPQATDEEIVAIIGPPDFLTGCEVAGDLTALARGEATDLTLRARIILDEDSHQIMVQNIPPNVSTDDVLMSVTDRASQHGWAARHPELHKAAGLPIEDVRDLSSEDSDRFVCIPLPGTSLETLRDQLWDVYGISTTMPVALPRPLPDMVWQWVTANGNEDVLASVAALEGAIAGDRRGSSG
jgi:DNA gyrase/topoisomerase IV, subunit A